MLSPGGACYALHVQQYIWEGTSVPVSCPHPSTLYFLTPPAVDYRKLATEMFGQADEPEVSPGTLGQQHMGQAAATVGSSSCGSAASCRATRRAD